MKTVRPIFWIIAGMAVLCLAAVGFYTVKSGRFPGARANLEGISPGTGGRTADPRELSNAIATLLGPNAGNVEMIGTAMAINPGPGTPNVMATWIWQLTATQTTSTPTFAVRGTIAVTAGTPGVTLTGIQPTSIWTGTPTATGLVQQTATSPSSVPTLTTPATGLPPTAVTVVPPTATTTVPRPPTLTNTPVPPPPTRTPIPPTPTPTDKHWRKTPSPTPVSLR